MIVKFDEALKLMKDGTPMKLPSWGGYWVWDNDRETIVMHTKEGKEMDKEKKKRVKNDLAALVKAVKHTKIDKITDGQAEEIRRAKEQLERTLEE